MCCIFVGQVPIARVLGSVQAIKFRVWILLTNSRKETYPKGWSSTIVYTTDVEQQHDDVLTHNTPNHHAPRGHMQAVHVVTTTHICMHILRIMQACIDPHTHTYPASDIWIPAHTRRRTPRYPHIPA